MCSHRCSCDWAGCRDHNQGECSKVAMHFQIEHLGVVDNLCAGCFEYQAERIQFAMRRMVSRDQVRELVVI